MFNVFERDVINMLLDGDHPFLDVLREQFAVSEVASREFSGAGFYLNLRVPGTSPRLPELKRLCISDVVGSIPSVLGGVGFVLYVENGVLSVLEGYTNGDDWDGAFEGYSLNYDHDGARDLGNLFGSIL